MNLDLERLIGLHDLDVMIADLERKEVQDREKMMGLSPDKAREELLTLRAEYIRNINKKWLGLYSQLTKHYGNAVVPAVACRCTGCLTRLPTAMCSDPERNDRINTCPTCSRIMYWAE
jgi:predicted  nucleic acid-binding Zn-ribbon protein